MMTRIAMLGVLMGLLAGCGGGSGTGTETSGSGTDAGTSTAAMMGSTSTPEPTTGTPMPTSAAPLTTTDTTDTTDVSTSSSSSTVYQASSPLRSHERPCHRNRFLAVCCVSVEAPCTRPRRRFSGRALNSRARRISCQSKPWCFQNR